MNEKRFKILFIFLHTGFIRPYKSVINYLAKKGHNIVIAFNTPQKDTMVTMDILTSLFRENSGNINIITKPLPKRGDHWRYASRVIRQMPDFFRYFDPIYDNSPKLRQRIENKTPKFLRIFFKTFGFPSLIRISDGIFRVMEHIIPPSMAIKRSLRQINPDILLISPYVVTPPSSQEDYIKCAKELGIKTQHLVASWDNLTNKGVIKVKTDKVVVWNNIQKEEAVKLHGIRPENVLVTGAQCFDKWFERRPNCSKKDFCSKVGFSDECKYILYLCSSTFIAPIEVDFINQWIQMIRNHPDPQINRIGILIRPHPQNIKQWDDTNILKVNGVVLYPRQGANPVTSETEDDYYHSMYHSVAVVGLNTTAMIEASILNKPVFTVIYDKFRTTQEGTLHFRLLVKHGLLYIAEDLRGHINQLNKLLLGQIHYKDKVRNFVRNFVRPLGINVDGTSIMGDNILKHCEVKTKRRTQHQLFNIITSVMSPVVYVADIMGSLHARYNRKLAQRHHAN